MLLTGLTDWKSSGNGGVCTVLFRCQPFYNCLAWLIVTDLGLWLLLFLQLPRDWSRMARVLAAVQRRTSAAAHFVESASHTAMLRDRLACQKQLRDFFRLRRTEVAQVANADLANKCMGKYSDPVIANRRRRTIQTKNEKGLATNGAVRSRAGSRQAVFVES